MVQPPRTGPKSLRSTMTRTTTSVCLPPRHRTNSLFSLFSRSARASPPLAVGLPPAPNPQSVAQLPTVPPPEQTGHPQSQQRDQRSPPAPVSKVGLVVGRAANSHQQPPLCVHGRGVLSGIKWIVRWA